MKPFIFCGWKGELPPNEQLWIPDIKAWAEQLKVEARKANCYDDFAVLKFAREQVEQETERRILSDGVVPVVQCGYLTNHENDIYRNMATMVGIVPLRWAVRRILLTPPAVGRLIHDGEEPVRIWRLWRYRWDAEQDGFADGKPFMVETAIREAIAAGRDWRELVVRPDEKVKE